MKKKSIGSSWDNIDTQRVSGLEDVSRGTCRDHDFITKAISYTMRIP